MKLDRKQDLKVLCQVCVFPVVKKRWPPWPLIILDIFDFSSETAQQNSTSPKFVFFLPIRKTRWLSWHLIGWDIFNFFSKTAARNSTKLDRTQDLYVLYQVCVFQADRKNKMAALASDWLRHFRILLWNHWTEFNKTWKEARSQRPLQSLCFRGDQKNKMAALASDWLRHFQLSEYKILHVAIKSVNSTFSLVRWWDFACSLFDTWPHMLRGVLSKLRTFCISIIQFHN